MEDLELPKDQWGRGPWYDEPDRLEWQDLTTRLPCMAIRNPVGVWCGYVGVPASHPAYGCDTDKLYEKFYLEAHGGINYAHGCDGRICHHWEGLTDDTWWIGFDCGHAWDLTPLFTRDDEIFAQLFPITGIDTSGTYRDMRYVVEEVTDLAQQLFKVRRKDV